MAEDPTNSVPLSDSTSSYKKSGSFNSNIIFAPGRDNIIFVDDLVTDATYAEPDALTKGSFQGPAAISNSETKDDGGTPATFRSEKVVWVPPRNNRPDKEVERDAVTIILSKGADLLNPRENSEPIYEHVSSDEEQIEDAYKITNLLQKRPSPPPLPILDPPSHMLDRTPSQHKINFN